MKLSFKRSVLFFVLSLAGLNGIAQNVFFSDSPEPAFKNPALKRVIIPVKYRTVKLDTSGFLSFAKLLPAEKKIAIRNLAPVIALPMPDGTTARFHVWESSTLAPELAAANPGIKTFTGQGIDDATATIKLDWTEFGFHAQILSPTNGTVYIDPYDQQTTTNYISYYKKDHFKKGSFSETGPFLKSPQTLSRPAANGVLTGGTCIGAQLLTYRLAIACTHEYAIAATRLAQPTAQQALSVIVTTTNRVNGVYERELDIRLVLIASENSVIFVDAATDPFTGNSVPATLLSESQTVIDSRIGSANYDIGHTFSTGGGGVAYLGVVCINGSKAGGITGSADPVGDGYDIDYVAHEMGHQFGGNHSFNSLADNCGGNGSLTTNAEPGSGSTIMAYAGICGADDLQAHSDAQFNALSFNEITDYVINGGGNGCPLLSATNNNPPVVNAGLDYVIPKSTPFSLTGSGTDPNGDALTFSWEQINVGGPFGPWNSPSGNAPIFRSFVPKSTPVRFFPQLTDVINGTTTIGELLPTYARTMNFRLTARDNKAGGGGVCFDESVVTVTASAGPFLVTYPNAIGVTWYVNDFKTITWDPSGTTASPISCSNVKIELSTDGGNTYPVTISSSTPNDGTEEIQVPNNITNTARIRITAVGNIFYDISNTNFSIQNSPTAEFVFNTPAITPVCGAGSAAITLKTGALGGFTTSINLSASGNPAGTSVTFGTSPLTPGSSTLVTLNNTGSLASGTYNITVSGIAGAVTKSRIIPFIISGSPTAPTSLTAPAYNSIGVPALASFNWSPVSGASFYKLEIATSNTFATIAQTISNITTLPIVLNTALVENTVYYWRVTTTNACGTSAASYSGIFKTGANPCKTSTDVPKTISATGTPIVLSTIVIPANLGTIISDLNVVSLVGAHSYVSDITATLTSPAGTSVTLFDQVCDGYQNFNLNLDDEAVSAIACPISDGQTSKPQNLLSAFDGQNSTGTWTLKIKDNFSSDGGTLSTWGLSINNCVYLSSPISTTPWTQLCVPGNTSLTTDFEGISYQWQINTGSGFTTLLANANYAGVSTKTLQIINAPSSFSGYQYRCVVDGANGTIYKLGFAGIWNGSASNAWENPANWNCNSIPDANTDVIINSGTPVVSSAAICRSITVNPAASITVNTGFKITVMH